jgi:unsaturated pyranuronate lyase
MATILTPPLAMTATFPKLTSLPTREILGGAIRGQYAHLPTMTIGEVLLDASTIVPMHSHPHEQVTYVIDGRFEFTVGNETTVLEPGMAALIPSGATHGGKTITSCRVIDVFSPARDDYR